MALAPKVMWPSGFAVEEAEGAEGLLAGGWGAGRLVDRDDDAAAAGGGDAEAGGAGVDVGPGVFGPGLGAVDDEVGAEAGHVDGGV